MADILPAQAPGNHDRFCVVQLQEQSPADDRSGGTSARRNWQHDERGSSKEPEDMRRGNRGRHPLQQASALSPVGLRTSCLICSRNSAVMNCIVQHGLGHTTREYFDCARKDGPLWGSMVCDDNVAAALCLKLEPLETEFWHCQCRSLRLLFISNVIAIQDSSHTALILNDCH